MLLKISIITAEYFMILSKQADLGCLYFEDWPTGGSVGKQNNILHLNATRAFAFCCGYTTVVAF